MRTTTKTAIVVTGLATATMWARRASHARGTLRRASDAGARRLRYWSGRIQGLSYHLRGRRPDPNVSDDVLADRIRSSIGPLEKRLDIPHIHVMVEDHTALLHGEVPTPEDAATIERSVLRVSGVVGVESYLHLGMGTGATRPSEGTGTQPPSMAREILLEAARGAGASAAQALPMVRATLFTFAERVPPDERSQVLTHLPEDVRTLFEPPRRLGTPVTRLRTVEELVAFALASGDGLDPDTARHVVTAVLHALADLVPEEKADVAVVLPHDLRDLWLAETGA